VDTELLHKVASPTPRNGEADQVQGQTASRERKETRKDKEGERE
jgi:hypothetical protein